MTTTPRIVACDQSCGSNGDVLGLVITLAVIAAAVLLLLKHRWGWGNVWIYLVPRSVRRRVLAKREGWRG